MNDHCVSWDVCPEVRETVKSVDRGVTRDTRKATSCCDADGLVGPSGQGAEAIVLLGGRRGLLK